MLRKIELLENAKAHYAADMLLKRTYGTVLGGKFKGCSVGCHLRHIKPTFDGDAHDYDDKHGIVARYYGYPEWLAHLQDTIFEGLPDDESARWHVQLAERIAALPDEPDWQRILHRVHVAILRIALRAAGTAQEVVQQVIDLHERAGNGEIVSDELWSAAESAAWSAKWSARSAAYQEMRDAILEAIAA